ncbi:tyrosine-type recombinase/integrase [Paenibacillus sp. LMG 31458]|uniref:Tyrosine-type recombinase/integrase n=1 Tax=Paenibacillus phytorum TaxID=2654977 RepID=A0ABX1XWA3_9BACL|nr:integrase [Paenibacillus phytorum]NOU72549.1 tyrosine-type recombinase/integrase [Paenibacillus phytorum]
MWTAKERKSENDIVLEIMSDEAFDFKFFESRAKGILEALQKDGLLIEGGFDENYLVCSNHLSPGRKIYFSFNECLKAGCNEKYTEVIKCWVIELLGEYYPSSVVPLYSDLLEALEITNGFHKENVDQFIDFFHYDLRSDNRKATIINAVCNFFDYSDFEAGEIYVPRLLEVRKKFKIKVSPRELPPSTEVLKFSYYLEKYFEELYDQNIGWVKKKIMYYPVLIWWKLTNIVPIRASEFCLIKRECVFSINDKYYLRLPREKKPKEKKNIQIIDTIEITCEMYSMIEEYLVATKQYGETATLISYRSLIWADRTEVRESFKNDHNYFSREALDNLVKRFYKEIIGAKYNIHIQADNRVSPNDTRHFAFCSLMMQGISPVEIARLGGHRTIRAQYHYSYHLEYWIDSEVFKLMNKFQHNAQIELNNNLSMNWFLPDEIKSKAYKPALSKIKKKLSVGYCTDEAQRCMTSECMLCDHWRIDPEELIEKIEVIQKRMSIRRNNVYELSAFLENLHRIIFSDVLERSNPKNYSEIKITVKQINDEINALAKMKFHSWR